MFVIEDFFNFLFGEKDTVFEEKFGSMAGFGMSIIKDIAETVASVAYEIFKILFIKIVLLYLFPLNLGIICCLYFEVTLRILFI